MLKGSKCKVKMPARQKEGLLTSPLHIHSHTFSTIYIPTYTKHISNDLIAPKCRGLINIGYSNYESLLVTSNEIYLYLLDLS